MHCSKCGNKIGEGSLFCSKCGAELGESTWDTIKTSLKQNDSNQNQAKRTIGKPVIMLLVAVVLIGAVVVAGFSTEWFGFFPDDELTDVRIDEVHAAEREIEAAVNADDELAKQFEDALSVVEEQQSRGLVDSYSVNLSGIEVRYAYGITYIYTPDYSDYDILLPGQGSNQAYAASVETDYGDCLLIGTPTTNGWRDGSLHKGANDANVLMDSTGDFVVSSFENEQSNLENLRWTLKDYDVIIWSGHGAYTQRNGPILLTGEKVSARKATQLELKQEQVIEHSSGYYCISGKFFDNNYKAGDFSNQLFYFGSCDSGEDDRLANSLLSKGASTIVAFDYIVTQAYGNKMMATFFEELIKKTNEGFYFNDVNNCLTIAQDRHGLNDSNIVKDLVLPSIIPVAQARDHGAELKIFGDANYKLSYAIPPVYSQDENTIESDEQASSPSTTTPAPVSPAPESGNSSAYSGDFSIIGLWKVTDCRYQGVGQAQLNAIVKFTDQNQCNLISPSDTYILEKRSDTSDEYLLSYTTLLGGSGSVLIKVIDENNIEIRDGEEWGASLRRSQ